MPGQAEGCVTLHVGYGRTRGGRVANGKGFDAYPLRSTAGLWSRAGLEVRKTGGRYPLATTQHHYGMEGRDLVRAVTAEEYRRDPDAVRKMGEHAAGPGRHALPEAADGKLRLGAVDRPRVLRRMQRLCRGLPVGEQHPRRRQARGRARPRPAVDPDRPLLLRRARESRRPSTSPSPACTARTRRAKSSARSTPRCTAPRA